MYRKILTVQNFEKLWKIEVGKVQHQVNHQWPQRMRRSRVSQIHLAK